MRKMGILILGGAGATHLLMDEYGGGVYAKNVGTPLLVGAQMLVHGDVKEKGNIVTTLY